MEGQIRGFSGLRTDAQNFLQLFRWGDVHSVATCDSATRCDDHSGLPTGADPHPKWVLSGQLARTAATGLTA